MEKRWFGAGFWSNEKLLDPVDAARKANMSESEFMKLVQGQS